MFTKLQARLAETGSVTFAVSIRPGAKRTTVRDLLTNGTIKIDVAAPPEDGKANAALIRFLAGAFGVAPSRVSILRGFSNRRKEIRIERGQ